MELKQLAKQTLINKGMRQPNHPPMPPISITVEGVEKMLSDLNRTNQVFLIISVQEF